MVFFQGVENLKKSLETYKNPNTYYLVQPEMSQILFDSEYLPKKYVDFQT